MITVSCRKAAAYDHETHTFHGLKPQLLRSIYDISSFITIVCQYCLEPEREQFARCYTHCSQSQLMLSCVVLKVALHERYINTADKYYRD